MSPRLTRSVWPLALVLFAAMALAAVLCGCSNGSTSGNGASPSAQPSQQANITAPATGSLPSITWWVWYRPPLTLDPVKFYDYPEDTIMDNLYEPLQTLNADNQIVPGVATVNSPDPQTWIYTLRPGVCFWDGTKVTTDDVIFSLERNQDPKTASFYGYMLRDVESIKATGPGEVTIKLKSPDVSFNERMVSCVSMILSKKVAEKAGDKYGTPNGAVMGTGAFKLQSWDGSTSLTMVRNENYWNSDGVAKVDSIKFVWPQDVGTVTNGFASGEFDGGFDLAKSAIPALQKSTVGKVYVGSPEQTRMIDGFMFVNTEGSAAADPRLRQALYLCIDRQAICETIYHGTATPLYSLTGPGWYPPDQPEVHDVYQKAYDEIAAQASDLTAAREKAKALVKEAGATAQLPITVATTTDPIGQMELAIIQDGCKKVGLNFRIKTLPAEQFGPLFSDPAARKRLGVNAIGTQNYDHCQDPGLMYDDALTPGSPCDFTGYDNPEVNALMAKQKAETDPVKRAEIIVQLEKIFNRDLPWITVVAPETTLFMNNRITGAPISFTYLASPWASKVGAP